MDNIFIGRLSETPVLASLVLMMMCVCVYSRSNGMCLCVFFFFRAEQVNASLALALDRPAGWVEMRERVALSLGRITNNNHNQIQTVAETGLQKKKKMPSAFGNAKNPQSQRFIAQSNFCRGWVN